MRAPALDVRVTTIDGRLNVALAGELDRASAYQLEVFLGQLSSRSIAVRFDISQLTFLDAAGAAVLANIRAACGEEGLFEISRDLSEETMRFVELVETASAA